MEDGPVKSDSENSGQAVDEPTAGQPGQPGQQVDTPSLPSRPIALSFSADVDVKNTKPQMIQLKVDPKSVSGVIKYRLLTPGSGSLRLIDPEKGVVEYINPSNVSPGIFEFQYSVISAVGESRPATVVVNRIVPTR